MTGDGADRAAAALATSGIEHTITRHGRVGSLEEAAAARGVEPGDIIKTLVVRRAEDDYLFVLVPAGRRFDWPKLRAHLGVSRLSLPDADEAQAATGYVRYTITPFGSTHPWPVIADAAVDGLEKVAIGGGDFGVNLHLAPADLVRALDADVVDVTVPEPEHQH